MDVIIFSGDHLFFNGFLSGFKLFGKRFLVKFFDVHGVQMTWESQPFDSHLWFFGEIFSPLPALVKTFFGEIFLPM
jgi:hypothetical protein